MLMGERHGEDRRLPARRPGPHGHGQQIEPRLVSPDDGSPLLSGFFSSAGQRSCHHAWIAVSSRWVARARGRWTLCRTACKSRLTCAGWYFTPSVRRMTSATRWQVQICPRNPYASAPASRSAGIGASWSAVSRGCRPGAGWRRSPSPPPLASALEPLADRPRRHPQRGGDILLFPALLLQLPGASPPSFAPVELGRLGAHAASVASL
jgi:hypothetical protein